MLIDDDETDQMINELLITASNFADKRIIKFSSSSALSFLKNEAIEKNQVPDLIFLDIRMSLADGFEFLEEYKHLPEPIVGTTKIVMLTSSIDGTDVSRANANKFVQFLINKPLTLEKLADLKTKI
jgi:CheY-like chemotaxis protein